jgi:hypothetical protein
VLAALALGAAILSGGCDVEGLRDLSNPAKAMLATPQMSPPIAKPGGIYTSVTGIDVYPQSRFKNGRGFNGEIREALAASVEKAGFGPGLEGSARYKLVADIVDCTLPESGMAMTVSTEVNYSLTDARDGRLIWHKTIKSSDTRNPGDAITGSIRAFDALEGAFRKSIEVAVVEIAALPPG